MQKIGSCALSWPRHCVLGMGMASFGVMIKMDNLK